jgi:glycine oxidase
MPDVVVIGAGVIGLSCAWELAQAGLQVELHDCSAGGTEASWAGAGMIPPGDTECAATDQLAQLSSRLWPEVSRRLLDLTGIDNEYQPSGGVLLASTIEELEALQQGWQRRGKAVQRLRQAELLTLEPGLNPEISAGLFLPEMAQVRNPRHLKALQAACLQAGVKIVPDQGIVGWEFGQGQVQAALTPNGRLQAGSFLVTAGAWTSELLRPLTPDLGIRPIRGQIVQLKADQPVFGRVIESGKYYLVPRLDGLVLIGATEEDVGFVKANTGEAIERLLRYAVETVPALAGLPIVRTWSGLRPFSAFGHPSLGKMPGLENLWIAAGHFRAGLSNSPATALVMRQLLLGESPAVDVSGFAIAS